MVREALHNTPKHPDNNSQYNTHNIQEDCLSHGKLPFVRLRKIIGLGGKSVAIRVTSNNEGQNYIAVFRPLSEEIIQRHNAQRIIREELPELTHDQHLVITHGSDNNRYAVKLTKEIEGSNLYDLSLLYSIGNFRLRRNLLKFGLRVLEMYANNHVLVDLWGRPAPTVLKKLKIALNPFETSNVIASENDFSLHLVDAEPLLEDINPRDFKDKSRHLLQITSILSWTMFESAVDIISKVMANIKRKHLEPKETKNFKEGLKQITTALETSGIEYRILGSVAYAAWMSHFSQPVTLTDFRWNRSKRDVDILCLCSPTDAKQLQIELNKILKTNDNYPEVALVYPLPDEEYTASEDKRIGNKIRVMNSRITMDAESIYLRYHNLRIPITAKDLEPMSVLYENIPIRTLKPGVLTGLTITRGGAIKFKDLDKMMNLIEASGEHIPIEYLDFARKIKTEYRDEYKNFLVKELLVFPIIPTIRLLLDKLKELIYRR